MFSLPNLVQSLLQPTAYPEPPAQIELVQAQMSFVFLVGDYVYKIKKPVDLGYLDYTTLAKRKLLCEKELFLNRRLCPDVYLAVLPIADNKGIISLGGLGEVVEYAVKMRYLPQSRMMNVLLPQGEVTLPMIGEVAALLADFHRRAETNPEIRAFGSFDALKVNIDENFSQTESYIGKTITPRSYQSIKKYSDWFMAQNRSLFDKRVSGGSIRDCHGDLHAAHVCFANGICIYDCIEFNDRFRYCDVASEIAFLAMDLDRYGRADLSRHFVENYVRLNQDEGLLPLLNFYKCYRAYVRGKVEGFKINDPYIAAAAKEQAQRVAASYFDLAERYIN